MFRWNKWTKIVVAIVVIILTIGVITSLIGSFTALKRPTTTVINATIEVVTGGNSAKILTAESPAHQRFGNASRIAFGLAIAMGIMGLIGWRLGISPRTLASRAPLYVVLASLMVFLIFNHLAPNYLDWLVQIAIIAGIWVIIQLLDVNDSKGKKVLAWTLAICLIALGLENLNRTTNWSKKNPKSESTTVSNSDTRMKGVKKEVIIVAPVAPAWSRWETIPNKVTWIITPKGEVNCEFASGKKRREGPNQDMSQDGTLRSVQDGTRRYQSLEDHPVEVVYQYEY